MLPGLKLGVHNFDRGVALVNVDARYRNRCCCEAKGSELFHIKTPNSSPEGQGGKSVGPCERSIGRVFSIRKRALLQSGSVGRNGNLLAGNRALRIWPNEQDPMIRPGWPKFGRLKRSRFSVRDCLLALRLSRAVLMVEELSSVKPDLITTLRPRGPLGASLGLSADDRADPPEVHRAQFFHQIE